MKIRMLENIVEYSVGYKNKKILIKGIYWKLITILINWWKYVQCSAWRIFWHCRSASGVSWVVNGHRVQKGAANLPIMPSSIPISGPPGCQISPCSDVTLLLIPCPKMDGAQYSQICLRREIGRKKAGRIFSFGGMWKKGEQNLLTECPSMN